LILNGNPPPRPVMTSNLGTKSNPADAAVSEAASTTETETQPNIFVRIPRIYQQEDLQGIRLRIKSRLDFSRQIEKLQHLAYGVRGVWRTEGWLGIRLRLTQRLSWLLERQGLARWMPASLKARQNPLLF